MTILSLDFDEKVKIFSQEVVLEEALVDLAEEAVLDVALEVVEVWVAKVEL